MKIGVYGDVHLTKNMRGLQSIWEVTATKSIYNIYETFDAEDVELVVCLGDFFDAPKLEAKHLNFVLPILDYMNSKTYPTYILLGNHEADTEESNILEYLSVYENIYPVTTATIMEDMCFIPYYDDPTTIDMKDKIVFTHHDIYGSSLASGKTKAFFGLDPSIFKDAKLVMNGHVHLKSQVSKNIVNAGSLLVSQQGELRLGEYPSYYIVDTKKAEIILSLENVESMAYLTIDNDNGRHIDLLKEYEPAHLVLKIEYEGELPKESIEAAHISWRKKIESIGESDTTAVRTSNFDMKNYLVDYIKKDQSVSDNLKDDYTTTGLELLS